MGTGRKRPGATCKPWLSYASYPVNNDFTWFLRIEICDLLNSILDQNIANYYPGRYILSHLCKTLTLKNDSNSIFPRCRQKSHMFCVPCNSFDNFRLNWRLYYVELFLDTSLGNRTHLCLVCGQETNILFHKEIWLFNWKYKLFLHKYDKVETLFFKMHTVLIWAFSGSNQCDCFATQLPS